MKEIVVRDFYDFAGEIVEAESFKQIDQYIQHGTITCYQHCIGVAVFSLYISRKLGIKCDEKSLVKGALLHDYFLYDWHCKDDDRRKLHGFFHARIAMNNAVRDFGLNRIEREIVLKHMWPLTFWPPMCREAWIVNFVDTFCSLLETIGKYRWFRFMSLIVLNASVI